MVPSDDIFGMSDDDFHKATPMKVEKEAKASSSADTTVEPPKTDETDAPSSGSPAVADDTAVPDAASEDVKEGDDEPEIVEEDDATLAAKTKPDDKQAEPKPDDAEAAAKAAEEAAKNGGKSSETGEVTAPEPKPEEYKSFYESLINKPIRANGKDIILKTPEEVQRLVQMGAGYGRKLQEMQPHLKTLRMLEKNKLLDETELSFLIDIRNKNPDAIKKLIKDSGIDPLDLNMDDNTSYRPNDHTVSENEMEFDDVLREVSAQPGGRDTIKTLNETWDDESKSALWKTPDLLRLIQTQRENGLYAQITAEIDRQKVLGNIPLKAPFLEAYKLAGDALVAAKSLILPGVAPTPKTPENASTAQVDQQTGRVLAVREAAPKVQASNNDKAKAAGSPVASPRKAKETVNPLDVADDDFMKQFDGRL